MTSAAELLAELDPRVRAVMGAEVLAMFGIVLAVATGQVGFGLAVLGFVGVFLVTGVAYAYLLVFG